MKQKEAIRKIWKLKHLLENEKRYKKVAEKEQTKHKRRLRECEECVKHYQSLIDRQRGYIEKSASTISSLESQIKELEDALE